MKYTPSFVFKNGYINTIYPTYFRKIKDITYIREEIVTKDDDFLILDWSLSKSNNKTKWLAIISHGLEGDSHRVYVKGMARAFNSIHIDVLACNFRGCGGKINKKPYMYHSCKIDDLETVIKHSINKGYKKIVLIGFSMGGNLTLYYIGKLEKLPQEIKGAITFSVPLDLEDASKTLAKLRNKIFMRRFLNMLKDKIKEKSRMFPNKIQFKNYRKIKNFKDFDNKYTAPLNGFKDAYHYWKICSSYQYLESISIPTLIVNAKDDPFLGEKCYPQNIKNPNLTIEFPAYGGHVGFMINKKSIFNYSELRALEFFSKNIIPQS